MLLPFEGITYPALEDEYSILALEPTHSDEDEEFYCDEILTGNYEDEQADYGDHYERDYDPDYDGSLARHAGDVWERHFWGD
jgi:hypothetical protein